MTVRVRAWSRFQLPPEDLCCRRNTPVIRRTLIAGDVTMLRNVAIRVAAPTASICTTEPRSVPPSRRGTTSIRLALHLSRCIRGQLLRPPTRRMRLTTNLWSLERVAHTANGSWSLRKLGEHYVTWPFAAQPNHAPGEYRIKVFHNALHRRVHFAIIYCAANVFLFCTTNVFICSYFVVFNNRLSFCIVIFLSPRPSLQYTQMINNPQLVVDYALLVLHMFHDSRTRFSFKLTLYLFTTAVISFARGFSRSKI